MRNGGEGGGWRYQSSTDMRNGGVGSWGGGGGGIRVSEKMHPETPVIGELTSAQDR